MVVRSDRPIHFSTYLLDLFSLRVSDFADHPDDLTSTLGEPLAEKFPDTHIGYCPLDSIQAFLTFTLSYLYGT